MGAYGVITQGQNSADVNGIGGVGISGISKRPARVCKLPAKFKDAPIGNRSVQASKIRRNMAITDDEDKVQPQKKKPKTRLLVDTEPDTDTDQVSLNEGHREKNTTSEDAQDTVLVQIQMSQAIGMIWGKHQLRKPTHLMQWDVDQMRKSGSFRNWTRWLRRMHRYVTCVLTLE